MTEILQDIEGVVCHINDILVHGKNHDEHRKQYITVLHHLQESGLTLNAEKCQFQRTEVKFLRQIIDNTRIYPDPAKIAAIQNELNPMYC